MAAAAAILAVLAYRQVARLTAPRGTMVVAAVAIPKDTILTPAHLRLAALGKAAPAGTLPSPDRVRGRVLAVAKQAGEPILQSDLKAPAAAVQPIASLIPEGRVLTTLTLKNLTVPLQDLRQGDRVDILAAGTTEARHRASRVVARDAYVLGYVRPQHEHTEEKAKGMLGIDVKPPAAAGRPAGDEAQALILALRPCDVVPVAEVDGSDAHISLIVHSRDSVKRGELLTFGAQNAPKTVEVIGGTTRQRVTIP
jgi:Flp pilus assembly protein CpaB